jgi:Nuclease-related domain
MLAAVAPVLRQPAQYGRMVLRQKALRLLALIACVTVFGLFAGVALGFGNPVTIGTELVLVAVCLAIDKFAFPELDRRERGNDGERLVGGILDSLDESGWLTLHDTTVGRGNFDHIVIGPGGIFTVETKSHGGKINTASLNPAWLKQAYAQAKSVERITGERVQPLLVFSRAYLDRPVSRHNGVVALPARMLAGHLARKPAVLSPDRVRVLHERLAAAMLGSST